MDYKKEYEEALERMKSWMNGEHPECFNDAKSAAEFVFPVLKKDYPAQSIIKFLINYNNGYCTKPSEAEIDSWIKYLNAKSNKNNFDRGYEIGASAEKYNHWRPTKEQLNSLASTIEYALDRDDEDAFYDIEMMKSLYNDLKKL